MTNNITVLPAQPNGGMLEAKLSNLLPCVNYLFSVYAKRLFLIRGPGYCAVYPPSTRRDVPVTKDASSEAKNKIPCAISRG